MEDTAYGEEWDIDSPERDVYVYVVRRSDPSVPVPTSRGITLEGPAAEGHHNPLTILDRTRNGPIYAETDAHRWTVAVSTQPGWSGNSVSHNAASYVKRPAWDSSSAGKKLLR